MRNTRYANLFYVKFLVYLVLFVHIFLTPLHNRPLTDEETFQIYPTDPDYEAKNAELRRLFAESNPHIRSTDYDDLRPEDMTQKRIKQQIWKTAKKHNIPVILWWSDLYPNITDFIEVDDGHACVLTRDRSFLSDDYTGILFYGSDIHWEDLPLPRSRNHIWALLHEESSKNNIELNFIETLSLFNYTSTFSQHSDVPLSPMFLDSIAYLTNPVKYAQRKDVDTRGSVLYIHSDCEVPTYRDIYTRELMKYISVDSYGACLNNKEFPDYLREGDNLLKYQHEDLYEFIYGYKFTLAFENARCDDYITEKFWRPLHMGSIPIYHGARNIRDWIPGPHSVIFAEDFDSPRALADYLHYLESNASAYKEYFAYKKNFSNKMLVRALDIKNSNDKGGIGFVDNLINLVCKKLNELIHARKRNISVPASIADIRHYKCDIPERDSVKLESGDEYLDWYNMYRSGRDHAKQVREHVIRNSQF